MSEPVGYLLTWTCYGTWLPGDSRGYVDDQHNRPGEEFAPPDEHRLHANALLLKHAPRRLGSRQRVIVQRAIVDHCRIRDWILHALNVRSNHVHVVVSSDAAPNVARDQFKSWSTRRLRLEGFFPKPAIVWTEGGSTRYLWNSCDLHAAVRYVTESQGPDLD